MEYLIGLSLALAVSLFARIVGLDRDRAFYPTVMIVIAALFVHGVFDFFHGHLIANPGVPVWYPAFCLTYDVTAAGWLTWMIRSGRSIPCS